METEPAWRDRRHGSADPMPGFGPIGKGTDIPDILKIVSLGRTIWFHLRDEKGLCRHEKSLSSPCLWGFSTTYSFWCRILSRLSIGEIVMTIVEWRFLIYS
jgi:hypothetical protein